jgi:hypothetical protein
VLEDGYQQVSRMDPSRLKGRMRIQYVNEVGLAEAGIDGGGLFKEFMEELLRQGFSPQVRGAADRAVLVPGHDLDACLLPACFAVPAPTHSQLCVCAPPRTCTQTARARILRHPPSTPHTTHPTPHPPTHPHTHTTHPHTHTTQCGLMAENPQHQLYPNPGAFGTWRDADQRLRFLGRCVCDCGARV